MLSNELCDVDVMSSTSWDAMSQRVGTDCDTTEFRVPSTQQPSHGYTHHICDSTTKTVTFPNRDLRVYANVRKGEVIKEAQEATGAVEEDDRILNLGALNIVADLGFFVAKGALEVGATAGKVGVGALAAGATGLMDGLGGAIGISQAKGLREKGDVVNANM